MTRVDASASRRQGGAGIGLALVRGLAELLGGTVEVESEVGRGSRFTVRLPRGADRAAVRQRAEWHERARERDEGARWHRLLKQLQEQYEGLLCAHEMLQQARGHLTAQARMAAVGALTGGISHELNNPLATILLQVQRLLRRVLEGSPRLSGLVSIERQTMRGRDLIRALIDYSRDKPLGRERVKVGQLAEGVTQIARSQERERDVTVEDTSLLSA